MLASLDPIPHFHANSFPSFLQDVASSAFSAHVTFLVGTLLLVSARYSGFIAIDVVEKLETFSCSPDTGAGDHRFDKDRTRLF